MKRLLFITCLALAGICHGQTSESITAKPLIAGSAVDAAADFVPIIDGSITAGQPALKRLPIDELVDVPGLFASVPNGTFSIAKTSGLQTALDGKLTASNIASGTITPKTGDLNFNSLGGGDVSAAVQGLRNTIDIIKTNTDAPIVCMLLGDSFSNFHVWNDVARVTGSFKCQALISDPGTSVTPVIDDFAKSPDGRYSSIASGGNLTCGHTTSGQQGAASHIYYTFFQGTGSAILEYNINGAGWITTGLTGNTIDTTASNSSIATNGVVIGSIALPQAYQKIACRVRASGGTVNGWIGQGMNGPGVTTINWGGYTGSEIEQAGSITESIWKAMVTGYFLTGGAQIINVTYADDRYVSMAGTPYAVGSAKWASTGASPMNNLHTWAKTARSTCDFVIYGPHHVSPAHLSGANATNDPLYVALGIGDSGRNTDQRIVDGAAQQRAFALAKGEAYVDMLDLFDYASGLASGFFDGVDLIHVTTKGRANKWAWALRSSALGAVFSDTIYYSRLRLGNAYLQPTTARSQGLPTLAAYSYAASPELLPMLASQMRVGNAVNPEAAGGLMWYDDPTYSLRFGQYAPSGSTLVARVELETANGKWRPVTDNAVPNGDVGKSWSVSHTNGQKFGYALKTADYTIARGTATDFMVHYKTAPFTVTLPLSIPSEATGVAGRVFVVKNSAVSGNITVTTMSDGTNLQKIDAATTTTVAPGESKRFMSVQTSGYTSADHGNWITF